MKQWHPIFVHLLRLLVEPHFEVRTNLPVGDMPREADTVLLRRQSSGPLPYHGIWKNLTTWNVIEYKGRTVSPRIRDLDLLAELGLGIDRRLNEERTQCGQRLLSPPQVSFWYVANHLGTRFLSKARTHLGGVETLGPGIWRWRILERLVFLVGSDQLAIEEDTVPLHLLSDEDPEAERNLARFGVRTPELMEHYGFWFPHLHKEGWKEIEKMAKTKKKPFEPDFEPMVEFLKQDKKMKERFLKLVQQSLGAKELLPYMSASERKELKRLLEE